MANTLQSNPLETEGNVLSTRFHLTKTDHVLSLLASIESFLAARPDMSRERLAENICGMSIANFSKVSNGQQGDFLALVDKLPSEIRDDYDARLEDLRRQDPILQLVEQMVATAFRLAAVSGRTQLRLGHTEQRKVANG